MYVLTGSTFDAEFDSECIFTVDGPYPVSCVRACCEVVMATSVVDILRDRVDRHLVIVERRDGMYHPLHQE